MYHQNPATAEIILDSVTDGVFTVDLEGRITAFNRAAVQITGVPREEALGQPCCDVFRASICESACAMKETQATGRPVINRPVYIIGPEGDRIPISISTALLRDTDGTLIGGVETFRDLTLVEELRKQIEQRYSFGDIIGRSPAMQSLFDIIATVASSESTVVLEGESGTGKELFARALHELSPRHKGRFVAINCGALPDTLLESELFGHTAGAFTGARGDRPGRFEIARGGTIFLDEIGDISPAMQVRLLRVLQERVFEPLGSVDPVEADVRVIAATNRKLDALVEEGTFRTDLFFRLNVIRLELPPLRDRREDIPLLVDHFIARFNRSQGRSVVGVSDEVLAVLMGHHFSGNVRELENILEHAFVLCRGDIIELQNLPKELVPEGGASKLQIPPGSTLKEIERIYITDALRRNHGNRNAAARELGIHPSTLFRKLRSLDIDVPERDGRSKPRG